MSVSLSSYESIVALVKQYYDPHMPCYYDQKHYDVLVQILGVLLQDQEYRLVETNVTMLEPITESSNYIYISIPLLAQLVNMPVEQPKAKIEFIQQFDLFRALESPVVDVNTTPNKACYNTNYKNQPDNRYSQKKHVQIVQLLRIVLAITHFYQHLIEKIPYSSHVGWKNLERAVEPVVDVQNEEDTIRRNSRYYIHDLL